jgi:acyl-coenzyme A synthetase/AMP-(fatty) acid ligase/acyl carrier protein
MKLPPEQQAIRAKAYHPSRTFVEFPEADAEKSVPERFEKIAQQYPDRIAVKTRAAALTYTELNGRANRLAHELIARRGSVAEPVALYLGERSDVVVAHMAVLKAGKFTIALEPLADANRSSHIVKDCGARVMIVDQDTSGAGAKLASNECTILNLTPLRSDLSQTNPGVQIPPEALAFLRYTSGSTGSAKGAMWTHRHVLRDAMGLINQLHLGSLDVLTTLSPASLGKHLLGPLLCGASFCPWNVQKEGLVLLLDWLRKERTTVYHSFATVLRYFLNSLPDSEVLADLRLLQLEGEPVYRNDVELVARHVSRDCFLVNTLSSSETGSVSMFFVDPKAPMPSERVPVGYPLPGLDVVILDDSGHPLGSDQLGEVAVRSKFFSAGYWGKPDLTRQATLVPSDAPLTYTYRTGDLGQLSSDGCVHLSGRKDFQVKIRNFRVDVTEVETALMEHRDVRRVAVVGRNDQSDNTILVAYVATRQKTRLDGTALRAFLKDKVRDFMIPTRFVFLDELPMLSNGKVNRRALPDLNDREIERTGAAPINAPRTPVEKTLAQIWAEALSVKQVGISDNFFDLGGHSLAATRVVSRVIQQFQLNIPIRFLFESPTIAAMATLIDAHQANILDEQAMAKLLDELDALSEEEAKKKVLKFDEGTQDEAAAGTTSDTGQGVPPIGNVR